MFFVGVDFIKKMRLNHKRNHNGYSLIETMTVISVIAIVLGLLYAYSDQGWKLFYQNLKILKFSEIFFGGCR